MNDLGMNALTKKQIHEYNKAIYCYSCKKQFTKENHKVHHHDHITGEYIAPLCNNCNKLIRVPKHLPVIIHNLTGYDLHLFIKELGCNKETVDIIPSNEERYISFSKTVGTIKLRFIDSFRFMAFSLDKLVSNLTNNQMVHTRQIFPIEEEFDLVTRKGVYPYDYMSDWNKFRQRKLPPKEKFYNKLNNTHISEENYEHAKKVWKTFNIKNLGQYHDLYLKTDVLLLTDVFENFRNTCLKAYGLDPAWYLTSPGLSWDAMLKLTEIELELLSDYNMVLMIEKGIRGGISECTKRYAKANNKYMESYDPKKESSYITYLDANNLYGWAMSQYIPHRGFKWLSEKEINSTDFTNVPDDSTTGYILEVDLEYPKELHDKHKDFPLAPQNMCPPGSKQTKLLGTLYNKEKYVLHYRNLKQYLSLGMKLKKIHIVIQFEQSQWLKKYIDLNTEMRTKATNEFEKDFYKLMNNTVFGKTMENIRKRVNIKLVTDAKKYEKLVAKPNYKSTTMFAERLVAVHSNKTKIVFNKPIYVGMSILDLSKSNV